MKFNLYSPCGNCPFRCDGKAIPLRGERAKQIYEYVSNDSTFACHNTTHSEDSRQWSHCAGALIILDKGPGIESNFLLRIAMEIFNLSPEQLRNHDQVFDKPEDMIAWHYEQQGVSI